MIGTAIAWRAARDGQAVTLIDPGGDDPRADDKASLVAAGMLGPVSESVFGEQDLLNLNLHAVDRFPAFNQELEEAAGKSTGLRTEGTLAVAYDSGDLAALDRLTDFRHSIGLKAERLDARECRKLEPFLAPARAAASSPPATCPSTTAATWPPSGRPPPRRASRTLSGTVTTVIDGQVLRNRARQVRGAGDDPRRAARRHRRRATPPAPSTASPAQVRTAIRPVKGQILRLRHPGSIPHILTHTVRAIVQGHDLYLVPRQDGELVVGATQEERDDRDVTAGAVHDLLRDATTAVPAVSELIFAEASAGLRPGTSDNGPILGPVQAAGGDGSLIIAAGHFRNGILLSAVTADAVARPPPRRGTARRLGPLRPRQIPEGGKHMTLTVNGDPRELPPGTTLADLVTQLVPSAQGVAAAVNGEVVPRRAWPDTPLADGSVVEVVTAVQGG